MCNLQSSHHGSRSSVAPPRGHLCEPSQTLLVADDRSTGSRDRKGNWGQQLHTSTQMEVYYL